ncbi:hypothetical protein [Paraburkholderia phenoliruptrix]|uniref:hypothetical protein n=1 Tax=Paraburkholderia phenoliruptrix TaxID=252970 RepID=UPI001C6E781A|nr:hypothetical protein [Paraburkholderia phenoliruptrix]MBW9102925.1 hypothetical protein [Paraburkholderia phenoliruptrix]MBW9132899.1 hypothetical protein [Paraburkholderia ginsengiterrae]
MSYDARVWARRQQLNDSSAKHLLKTFADWANEDYTVWVSAGELQADTEMNPKTISKYVAILVEMGYLRDTGQRQGATRQIIVYQMTAPPGSIIVQTVDQRNNGETKTYGPPDLEAFEATQKRKASKNGGVKDTQKRNPSKNGRLPKTDAKPPKFGEKDPQKRSESPPNLVDDKVLRVSEEVLEGDAREAAAGKPPTHTDETANPDTPPSGFDRFWAAWPGSSGRKQAAVLCRAHWDACGLEAFVDEIVAHVEAMSQTQHWRTGGDPTPIRYLEQKRWRDGLPTAEQSGAADDGTAWYESTPEVIEARGAELGVRPRKPDEPIASYRVLVVAASREKAAVDFVLRDAKRFNSHALYEFAVATFGDELLPVDFYAS